MSQSFSVHSTSARSAKVGDVWLERPADPDTSLTRKVMRPELVDNVHSDEARVKVTIVHQRRHTAKEPWQDYDAFSLATLKAGQEMKCALSAAETQDLFKALQPLYAITEGGIPKRNKTLTVVDDSEAVVVRGRPADVIRKLTKDNAEAFWEGLEQLSPDLFRAVSLMKLHQLREEAVHAFGQHMAAGDWAESAWQTFFERNTWIFGYGLTYRFLSTITPQPQYGGTLVTGRGGQRGDFFAATEAERRFTVLVEIKRPDSELVQDKLYRNSAHVLGDELAGGISQVQSNCRTWETEGARTEGNRELLERQACYTIQPKGILVIGHTEQLDTGAKRATFELLRRNLQNPEIITFDELHARAEHLLLNEDKEFKESGPPAPTEWQS